MDSKVDGRDVKREVNMQVKQFMTKLGTEDEASLIDIVIHGVSILVSCWLGASRSIPGAAGRNHISRSSLGALSRMCTQRAQKSVVKFSLRAMNRRQSGFGGR